MIGIVGGIGAGKSTVAAELAALGCRVIDADRIGHELLEDPQTRALVLARWPAAADAAGRVDRHVLGRVVFADAGELAALNAIVHPRIRRRMQEATEQARREPGVSAVAIDAAVLFEAGWDDLCTHLVFVQSPDAARLERVRRTRGWDGQAWRQRENSQFSLDSKRARCEYSVDNSSDVSCLRERIRELFRKIVHPV